MRFLNCTIYLIFILFYQSESGVNNIVFRTLDNRNVTGKTVALILARGGSKGIIKKNLIKINGMSILARAITTIKDSKLFSEIWVSTEDIDIASEAKKFQLTLVHAKVHNRPKNLALDNTTSIAAVSDFLKNHNYINAIALIQCTSVFLKIWHLQQAYELFQTSDCVFSVTRSHKLRWTLDNETKYMKSLNFSPNLRPRRQDWEGELIETGMFYFANRELIERNVFQNGRCRTVEVAERDALEIDTRYDLNLARCILNTEKYYD